MVKLHEGPDDSWELGDRYAEVSTLVVDMAHRDGFSCTGRPPTTEVLLR
jgi:hypothetical protein